MKKKGKKILKSWRNYSRTVIRSVTDLRFYREVRHKKVSATIGYLAVLLILFWIIPFSIAFFVGIRKGLDTFVLNLRTAIPLGTEFTMKDQKLTSNLTEPIVIRDQGLSIIVNTASSTLELDEGEVGVVVGSQAIVSKKAPDHFETVGYSTIPDFSISREGLDEWVGKYARWVILLVAVLSITILTVTLGAGYGIYIMAHAFFLWLVLRLLKRPLKYSAAFTITGFAATMPIILRSVFNWSGTDSGLIPTLLYWVLLAFIIYDAYRNNVKPPTEAPPVGPQKKET